MEDAVRRRSEHGGGRSEEGGEKGKRKTRKVSKRRWRLPQEPLSKLMASYYSKYSRSKPLEASCQLISFHEVPTDPTT